MRLETAVKRVVVASVPPGHNTLRKRPLLRIWRQISDDPLAAGAWTG